MDLVVVNEWPTTSIGWFDSECERKTKKVKTEHSANASISYRIIECLPKSAPSTSQSKQTQENSLKAKSSFFRMIEKFLPQLNHTMNSAYLFILIQKDEKIISLLLSSLLEMNKTFCCCCCLPCISLPLYFPLRWIHATISGLNALTRTLHDGA